jgi:hypothetical protein
MQAPTANADWSGFTDDLSHRLAKLAEDQYLIVSFEPANYYVQFAGQGNSGIRAEAVSNNYLVPPYTPLTAEQAEQLVKLGWHPPTVQTPSKPNEPHKPAGSPNFFLHLLAPVDFQAVAELATRALRDVYQVGHPGELKYTAFRKQTQRQSTGQPPAPTEPRERPMFVLRVDRLARGLATAYDGQYVKEYDPNRNGKSPDGQDMLCHLVTTPNLADAMKFADQQAARQRALEVDKRAPTRPDGQPNRPLTAFNIMLEQVQSDSIDAAILGAMKAVLKYSNLGDAQLESQYGVNTGAIQKAIDDWPSSHNNPVVEACLVEACTGVELDPEDERAVIVHGSAAGLAQLRAA